MDENRNLAKLATMDMTDYLILERIFCECEALCVCGWHERWFGDQD